MSAGRPATDARLAWQLQARTGAAWITIVGAASGGTPTGIDWEFRKTSGEVLRTGSVTC